MIKKLFFILLLNFNFLTVAFSNVTDSIVDFQARKFKYILANTVKYHTDSCGVEELSEVAFKAMLKSLDTNSDYFSKQEYHKIKNDTRGARQGIGIDVMVINDTAVVIEIFDGSPAQTADLKIGDRILYIDQKNVIRKEKKDILLDLEGDTNTKCNIIVKRPRFNNLIENNIRRSELINSGLDYFFYIGETKIAYLKITKFAETLSEDFFKITEQLKEADYIIIDLRSNLGGKLPVVCDILGCFLPKGALLTKTIARDTIFKFEKINPQDGCLLDKPLLVVIDGFSASGSEMFAGAIQDYDRGIIVGAKSYGKGSAQKTFEIQDSSAFKITVAKYATPLGRCFEVKKSKSVLDETLKLSMPNEEFNKLQKAIDEVGTGNINFVKTKKNRILLQSGGVLPDIKAYSDTLTNLTNVYISKGFFFEYAFKYNQNNPIELSDEDFIKHFRITDEIIRDFAKFSIDKKIWNQEMFEKDKVYIINYLKAYIGYVAYGKTVYWKTVINLDKVLIKTVENLKEAKNIIN